MFRHLSILLIAAILLVGCGGDVPKETGETGTDTSVQEEEASGTPEPIEEETSEIPELTGVGNTSGNINSGGLVAIQDGWVYYGDWADETLYKEKVDGGEKTAVIDQYARSINLMGDWIIYSNWSDNKSLSMVKTDGSEGTKIQYKNEEGELRSLLCDYMTVADNWIYLIDLQKVEDKIYRLRADGSAFTPLIEDAADSFTLDGEWIFYLSATDSNIYRMRLDGSDRTKFLDSSEDIEDEDYLATDGWFYFFHGSSSSGFKLEKIKADGSERVTIENMNPEGIGYIRSFNVYGEWIYYYPDGLSRIRTDGTEQTQIFDPEGDASMIHIAGDWIYFNAEGKGCRIKKDGTEFEEAFVLVR